MFGRTIRLGSANGIAIRMHPTFLVVLVWAVYQWGFRAHGGLAGMVFGLFVLVAVFSCVLLHELAHALAALRYGVRVEDIILLPVGGVARVEYSPLSPRAETVIALAGPALNLALATVLLPFIFLIASTRHLSEPIALVALVDDISPAGFIVYLWVANILLAAFNLLPAFPMDGGRVLRAGLASFRSRLEATRIAVAVGAVFAVLIALAGIVAGDYLMPLISIFVLVAASIELRHVSTETSLRGLPVGQYALWEGGGVNPNEPLANAISGGPRDVAVVEQGIVVGMLWRRELMRHLNGAHVRLTVADVMDRGVHVVESDDPIFDVHLWLIHSGLPAVPVVEQGRYRGIFTIERLSHVYEHVQARRSGWYRQRARLIGRRLGLI